MESGGRKELRHIVSVSQFDRKFLDEHCQRTQRIRVQCDRPDGARLLKEEFPNRRAVLYFPDDSLRTRLAFTAACQNLGVDVLLADDAHTSSVIRGESVLDALRTFASFGHVIVIRSSVPGLVRQAMEHLDATPRPRPIINAGSKEDEHPMQALADIYTLWRSFDKRGGIDEKTIVFVGDLAESRTLHGLVQLMPHYHDMTLLFVSPPGCRMKQAVLDEIDQHHDRVRYEVVDDLREAVRRADAVYITGIGENDAGEPRTVERDGFHFTAEHLALLSPHGAILHPLPRRGELDPACDNDPRNKVWRGPRNGVWSHTAGLKYLLDNQLRERKKRRR